MENNQLANQRKVEIIAEIANAHQGDPRIAYNLGLEGINSGADAIAAGSFFIYYGPHRAVLITYPTDHEL